MRGVGYREAYKGNRIRGDSTVLAVKRDTSTRETCHTDVRNYPNGVGGSDTLSVQMAAMKPVVARATESIPFLCG